jgi:CheY-like chemotaxis protein
LKKLLTDEHLSKAVPVFSIVDDVEADIQLALTYGIADYITPKDDLSTVVKKIEAVFSEGEVFAGSSVIDISPIEADISSTGIKVFVVEDDPLLRNLLSLRLDKSGFPYEFSKDGKNVVPVIKQFKPDIIILDLMLPGISGFEILEQIKNDQEISDTPVLVFSNNDGVDDRARAKTLGANDFYVKALTDLSELMEYIETLVNKSK